MSRNGPEGNHPKRGAAKTKAVVGANEPTTPFEAPRPHGARLALSVAECCESLGVGWDFWREHVEPEVRVVRCGRRKLIAVSELERWLDRRADPPMRPSR